MSIEKTVPELTTHKNNTIQKVDSFLDSLINNTSSDEEEKEQLKKKADLLCYWINDYIRLLNKEPHFDPKKLKRYKRGEIVKAHLGFRIGSEEGGLHYAVVLDNDNKLSSPTVTVVPLTSVKPDTDLDHLHKGNVYLGTEIYNSLTLKANLLSKTTQEKRNEAIKQLSDAQKQVDDAEKQFNESKKQLDESLNQLNEAEAHFTQLKTQFDSVNKQYDESKEHTDEEHKQFKETQKQLGEAVKHFIEATNQFEEAKERFDKLDELEFFSNGCNLDELKKKIMELEKKIKVLEKIKKEIKKMKKGSIALIGQIVTISKLRIHDPKTSYDVLAGIKLSDINLNKIDTEIISNFTKTT